ncbi:MAG: hypothetical protein RBR05_03010 [Candidatus Methanomethylophilaceae archaeon]|nr:hypothetical protein [Candidatus Methanomethylophilaceae archaeon]MDY0224355.1 hypothetical protein [Candidatus Methanomethylophilaceae archaeon]
MRMETGNTFMATIILVTIGGVLSLIYFLVIDNKTGTVAILYLVTFICLLISVVCIYLSKRRYDVIMVEKDIVECFRLKKEGIMREPADEIIPKGKMPEE